MPAQYNEIQELLRKRADLHARLNLMPYDGTPEIKERGDGKYLYVRKRVAGKQTSTSFARANMKMNIYDQAVLEGVAASFPQTAACQIL